MYTSSNSIWGPIHSHLLPTLGDPGDMGPQAALCDEWALLPHWRETQRSTGCLRSLLAAGCLGVGSTRKPRRHRTVEAASFTSNLSSADPSWANRTQLFKGSISLCIKWGAQILTTSRYHENCVLFYVKLRAQCLAHRKYTAEGQKKWGSRGHLAERGLVSWAWDILPVCNVSHK